MEDQLRSRKLASIQQSIKANILLSSKLSDVIFGLLLMHSDNILELLQFFFSLVCIIFSSITFASKEYRIIHGFNIFHQKFEAKGIYSIAVFLALSGAS